MYDKKETTCSTYWKRDDTPRSELLHEGVAWCIRSVYMASLTAWPIVFS